jgi:hypothetical protein
MLSLILVIQSIPQKYPELFHQRGESFKKYLIGLGAFLSRSIIFREFRDFFKFPIRNF